METGVIEGRIDASARRIVSASFHFLEGLLIASLIAVVEETQGEEEEDSGSDEGQAGVVEVPEEANEAFVVGMFFDS